MWAGHLAAQPTLPDVPLDDGALPTVNLARKLVDDVRSAADEQRDFHRNRAPNQTPATSGNFWDNLLGTPHL